MKKIIKNSDSLYLADEKNNKTYFCELIEITDRLIDICTGKEYIKCAIIKDGIKKEMSIQSYSILAGNFIKKFACYGLSLTDNQKNSSLLSEYLFDAANQCKPKLMHSSLGFYDVDGKLYFLADRTYPMTKSVYFKEDTGISRKGDFATWLSELKPYLEARPELQLALAIGASGTVNAYLKCIGVIDTSFTPLFALIGRSSTGKTTALKLAASLFGKPEYGTGMIYGAFDTDNFVYNTLSGRYGFPYFIDDTAVVHNKDFSQMIYQLSSGSDKHRLNTDLKASSAGSWLSSVIFTGESSIFTQTNSNSGLYARLIEFECNWTGNAETANAILSIIALNHGCAWQPFVEALMKDKDNLKSKYSEYFEQIKTKLPTTSNGLTDRITSMLSVVMLSAHILESICMFKYKMQSIMEMIINAASKNIAVDPVDDAYEAVLEYIAANMFGYGFKDKYFAGDKSKTHVWVASAYFRDLFKKLTGKEFDTMQKEFANRKYIRKFSDGYTSKHKLHDVITRCYCINISSFSKQSNSHSIANEKFGGINDED